MALKTHIMDVLTGNPIDTRGGLNGRMTLITETLSRLVGHFKSVSRTTAGSSTITSPDTDGSILLTDLIINTEKKQNGTVAVQFNDGTNSVEIFKAFCNDAPSNIALSFAGKWQGWENAYIEVVVVADTDTTVACGYVKIPPHSTQDYGAWDAAR